MSEKSWVLSMIRHPKATAELQYALNTIKPIMTDTEASREEKRKTLCMLVDELSEGTFNLKFIAEQIMTIINMKEEVCKEYPDSETQVEGILEWLPRMDTYRGLLLNEVKAHRKSCGLKV